MKKKNEEENEEENKEEKSSVTMYCIVTWYKNSMQVPNFSSRKQNSIL